MERDKIMPADKGRTIEEYSEKGTQSEVDNEESMLINFRIELEVFFNEMTEMLIGKRKDYGQSYDKIRRRFGEIVPLIRLNDKLMRYENLIKKDRSPENEPLIDVFHDIIGYCVLEIFYRRVR